MHCSSGKIEQQIDYFPDLYSQKLTVTV